MSPESTFFRAAELIGDRTIFLTESADVYSVKSAQPGQAPRSLLLLRDPEPAASCGSISASVTASPSHLAVSTVERTSDSCKYVRTEKPRIIAGPIDGPYTPIVTCPERSPQLKLVGNYPIVMSGSTLAYAGEDCVDGRVALRDLAKPGAPVERVVTEEAGLTTGVLLAERYLAVVRGSPSTTFARPSNVDRVDVYASETGAPLYEASEATPGRRFDAPYAGPFGFDLSSDGTLLVAAAYNANVPACNAITLSTYAASGTGPLELPVRGCDATVRIAGSRIAFVRRGEREYELVLADPAGGNVRPIARSLVRMDLKDFDGTRVVWSESGCVGETLFTAPITEAPVRPEPLACGAGAALVDRALKAGRDGRLDIPIRCAIGCTGTLWLRGPRSIRHDQFFSFTRRGVVSVDLSAKTKRRLEGRRTVRVRLKLRISNPGGSATSIAARRTLVLPRGGFTR